ncbi:MAG: hypothetical protein HRT35_19940 [Algicola sp.]|nr:hypothetical protein [Algicola sp.]
MAVKKFDKQALSQRFVGETVNFVKLMAANIKDNVDQHGEVIVENAGVTGSVFKVFGQQYLDSYFGKLSEHKLEAFGVKCYLKAAMDCAEQALKELPTEIFEGSFNLSTFTTTLQAQSDNTDDLRLYLNPTFNPAVKLVRQTYLAYLQQLGVSDDNCNQFSRAFEAEIKSSIKESFGKDYQAHQDEVKQKWFTQSEELLLATMSELKRVGLQEGESLDYAQTYGQWRDCDDLTNDTLAEAKEDEQQSVADLIGQHLRSADDDEWKNVITFIAADFGKGKTVYMKHHAAVLADEYLKTGSGALPVYFNLNQYRNDKKYDNQRHRGIIDSYLRQDFKILRF